jgi:hypothetical protein
VGGAKLLELGPARHLAVLAHDLADDARGREAGPEADQFGNDAIDADLGSGGILVIPNSHLCCGGGKESILYLWDQNSMGKADLDGPGQGAGGALDLHGDRMVHRNFVAGGRATLQLKDVRLICELAYRLKVVEFIG